MTASLSRRGFVAAGLSSTVVSVGGFPAGLFAQDSVSVEQFVALSDKLTETTGLQASVAESLLRGFLAAGNGPALAELVKEGTESTSYAEVADSLVAAWFTGVYDTGSGQAVATFTDALVWTALTFSKPFGDCGGETGYWSEPPEN